MDVRDVSKEKINYPENLFEDMFNLQKVLIDHYVGIEGLPQYPIDINTKKSQILLKDFSGRIIEELGEGYESYTQMLDIFRTGGDRDLMVPHLQNFNEEVSDALHFWLELMIFVGYETKVLESWLPEYIINKKGDLLDKWMMVGTMIIDSRFMLKKYPHYMALKDEDLDNEFLRGGRRLSSDIATNISMLLWDITFHLQIARNTLKNKPWKQTGMLTDRGQFEDSMKMTCFALFAFLSFTGFTPVSVYTIYYFKNKINQFRIHSLY